MQKDGTKTIAINIVPDKGLHAVIFPNQKVKIVKTKQEDSKNEINDVYEFSHDEDLGINNPSQNTIDKIRDKCKTYLPFL